MSTLGKITRRSLLIGAAAIAGGVAFGVYKVRQTPPNPLAQGLEDDAATFNAWVKIDSEKVTLITPHTDLGQGAYSAQAALIAEEMDLEFGGFEMSPGEPAAAYWNTALASDAVPFMSTDRGFVAETARDAMGAVMKLLGAQVTGGSTSMPDSFDKLRRAGAVARETLKAAAAKQTNVPVADLRTENGAVILPDGSQLKYTELAATAATIEPVTDVTLRDPSEWRLIGKPMQRLDIVAKSTGALPYTIDLKMDGMVYAAVKASPRRSALNSHDASAAEGMRGVKKIVPVTNGVAVIADNTWRAFKALDAITFDWAPAPYPAEQDQHWETVANSFNEDALDAEWLAKGDVEIALAEAQPIEMEYRAPYVAHQPLEPLSAVVKVDDGVIDIWACHQLPRFVQQRIAAKAGLESAENVRLHNQYAGGSFGHRLEFDFIDRAVEIAMEMKGTPVKLTFSREEDFAQDYPRQIGMARARGAVRDGRITAFDLQIATVSASRSQAGRLGQTIPGPDTQIAAGAWNLPYDLENFRVRAYAVEGLAPTSSWRAVGASTAGFFGDCALDELIHAAGLDPMEARLQLCNHDVSRKVLEAVAEMSGWGTDLGEGRGRGVAFVNSFGVPIAEVVEVTNTENGIRIDKVYVAADVGTVVDPVNFENHVQGGVVWGLGHAINAEITYKDGMAEQSNYHAHEGMRLHQTPEIIVRALENGSRVTGIGEPPVPPAPPALANAIFAATGQRIREMPFNKHIRFV